MQRSLEKGRALLATWHKDLVGLEHMLMAGLTESLGLTQLLAICRVADKMFASQEQIK